MDIILKVLLLYHLCQYTSSCNGGEFQGECYTFECGNSYIGDAVDSCNSVGATLISIHSLEEREFVRQLVRDSPHDEVFIGLILDQSTWEYYWTDGSDVDYLTDANDFEQIWGQYCHILDGGRNYDWEEVSCSLDYCGVCKQVVDEEAPGITCPDAITDVADPNQPYAAMTLENAEATDNIGVTHLHCSQFGSSNLNIGVTTITCTARDGANNQAQCTYDVTVTDTQPPTINFCPVTVVGAVSPSASTAAVSWSNPIFLDNSGVPPSVTSTHNSGDTFPLGDTTVMFTAVDDAALTVECTFIVRVEDNTPPVFTNCPSNIIVNTSPGEATGSASWDVLEATDNSLVAPVVDDSSVIGGNYPIGGHNIVFTATDYSGNSETCEFTVIVMDNESPVFTNCPEDQSVPTDTLLPTTTVTWTEPTATDNSGLNPEIHQTHHPNDVFRLGSEYVVYTALDLSGNNEQCTFSVTVFDPEAPIFHNGSGNIVVNTQPGLPSAPVTWPLADIAQDNSQEYPTINCTYISGHTFRFGNYTIDCTATDAAGNYVVHTFHVAIIDEEIPIFLSQPADIQVETDARQPYAHVDWVLPSVFDNSMEEVFINTTHHPNTTFPIGVTTVTYWAFDLFKNVNEFSFNITVIDMEYPVFYNLTQNISVLTEERVHYAHVSWVVVDVWDNSGEPLNITSDYHPGDIFYLGETWVTYTAIDKSGNIEMYTFSILVIDKEVPEVLYCPPDITIETWYRSPYVNVTWTSPNITDNVGILEVVSNYHSGDVFHLGVTTIVYNATDTALNFNDCRFIITVIDVEKPYFESCSLDIAVINIPGSAYSNVTWALPTAYDNSRVPPRVTSDAIPGDIFPLYDTIVTYTAVDESNNVELCRFKVTVNDVDLPYFTNFTDDVQVFIDSIHSNITVDWDPPYPADNSGVLPLLESTHQPGDTFQVGVTMVTYTATDETGNTMTHTFTVKIRVAFTDLRTILFNGTDDVDILQVSAIAVDRGKERHLTDNEIDDLEVMLLSMSSASEDIGNREPKVMTEELINVTSTVIDRKKNMAQQIDLVLASEILLKEIVTRQTNTTLKKSSETVASNIESVENAVWSFHFETKEEMLDSSRDNSKKAKNNAKGFVRVDPSSARYVPASAAIIVTYYDKVLFEESEGDEKSDVTFQAEAEKVLAVPYELASGLISCTVATNTSKHSVAIDYSMEVTTALLQTADEDDTLYYKQHAVCGFWDEDGRKWATLGCERTEITDYSSPIYCRCEHTTTFGIFLPAEKYGNFDYKLLAERIGIYFICLISIISIVYVMRAIHLIWGLFKGPLTIFIHSNLLVGALLLTLVFIVSSETMDFHIWCTILGVLIHFFYMSLLTWLIVECIYLYMLKTKLRIEGSSISKKPGYSICGWGGAASIAAMFFGIHYGYNDQSGCWLRFETGSLVAFIFPAMALILIRIILTVFMLTKEIKGKKRQEYIKAQIRRCIECSCLLIPFFILTWVFALMVDEQYIFWLMFYILFSLNGVFIALYCYCSFEMSEIRRHDRSLSSQTLIRSSTSVDKMGDPIVLAVDTDRCVQVAGEQPESRTDLAIDINSCEEVQTNEEEDQSESDESEIPSDTESEPSSDDSSETSEESDEGSEHSAESDKQDSNNEEKEDSNNEKSEKEESDDYDSDDACFG